jgi:hypothetical protein
VDLLPDRRIPLDLAEFAVLKIGVEARGLSAPVSNQRLCEWLIETSAPNFRRR